MQIQDTRTLRELAKEAYIAQNASNLAGVLYSAHRALVRLRELAEEGNTGGGWAAIDRHPVMILWADKIASLTDTQHVGGNRIMEAYKKVHEMIEGKR